MVSDKKDPAVGLGDSKPIDIDEMKVNILIVVTNLNRFATVAKFLTRRGWPTNVVQNITDAIKTIVHEKPDFVLLSYNHPSPKVKALPTLLAQSFNSISIAFGEEIDSKTTMALRTAKTTYKIEGAVSGPSIHRRITQILQDIYNPKDNTSGSKARSINNGEGDELEKGADNSKNVHIKQDELSSDTVVVKSSKSAEWGSDIRGDSEDRDQDQTSVLRDLQLQMEVEKEQLANEAKGKSKTSKDSKKDKKSSLGDDPKDETHTQKNVEKAQKGRVPSESLTSSKKEKATPSSNQIEEQKQKKQTLGEQANAIHNSITESIKEERLRAVGPETKNFQEGVEGQEISVNPKEQENKESSDGDDQNTNQNSVEGPDKLDFESKGSSVSQVENHTNSVLEKALLGEESDVDNLLDLFEKDSEKVKDQVTESGKMVSDKKTEHDLDPDIGNYDGPSKIHKRKLIKVESGFYEAVQKALEKVCSVAHGSVKKLTLVEKAQVLVINTEDVRGYLVLVHSDQKSNYMEYATRFREELRENLLKQSNGIELNEIFEINFQRVDFIKWGMSSSNVLFSQENKKEEVGIGFFPIDEPIPIVKNQRNSNMAYASPRFFDSEFPVDFRAYLHFQKNKKFYLYVKIGNKLSDRQIERLVGTNHDVFFDKKDIVKCKSYYIQFTIIKNILASLNDKAA